jgi:hypothetical protein
MGRLESPDQKPQDVEFFKVDEGGYDPKTGLFGSDLLMKNNMSWILRIPSDIKSGTYIMRQELLALHRAQKEAGAQFYISCLNVEVIGDGTATPPGVKFPGAYTPTDPGIKYNVYYGENRYVCPGCHLVPYKLSNIL